MASVTEQGLAFGKTKWSMDCLWPLRQPQRLRFRWLGHPTKTCGCSNHVNLSTNILRTMFYGTSGKRLWNWMMRIEADGHALKFSAGRTGRRRCCCCCPVRLGAAL